MNCDKYKLNIELPTVGKVDLSPFCLDRPVLLMVKDGEFVFTYFTPDKISTFTTPVDAKIKDLNTVMIETNKSCLENVDVKDLIGILTDSNSKYIKIESFIKDVKLATEIRMDLLNYHKSKIVEVIENKNVAEINQVAKDYYFILKANIIDIDHLSEIIDIEDMNDLKEVNKSHEEFLSTLIRRVNEEQSLNIKIDK